MAYIGRSPTPGEVIVLNSIESQFNGVLTTFNLTRTAGGVTSDFYPVSSGHLLVSLGGVIQEPDPTGDTGFRINYNTIIFAVPPPTGTSCFIVSYGNIIDIGTPADLTVTPAKLSTGGPSWDTSGNVTVSGNLTVNGSQTIINSAKLELEVVKVYEGRLRGSDFVPLQPVAESGQVQHDPRARLRSIG
jgi:hypothetical protein